MLGRVGLVLLLLLMYLVYFAEAEMGVADEAARSALLLLLLWLGLVREGEGWARSFVVFLLLFLLFLLLFRSDAQMVGDLRAELAIVCRR